MTWLFDHGLVNSVRVANCLATSHCAHGWLNPWQTKAWAKRLEENARIRENCRWVYSLSSLSRTAHNASGLFQVKLLYILRTKVARGWVSVSGTCTRSAVSELGCRTSVTQPFKGIAYRTGERGPESVGRESNWRHLVNFPTATLSLPDFWPLSWGLRLCSVEDIISAWTLALSPGEMCGIYLPSFYVWVKTILFNTDPLKEAFSFFPDK